MFSLSDDCIASGTAAPAAERRRRRFLLALLPAVPVAAGFSFFAGGIAAGVVAAAVGFAVWLFFRARVGVRRRVLWKEPFPPEFEKFLLRRIPHYRCLDAAGRELFRQRAKIFLDEVVIHGAGVNVADGLRLRACAAAVVPTLGFDEWEWVRLNEIIFRPDGYDHGVYQDENGVVTEYAESGMLGDSDVLSGVMMLSSKDLIWEFANPLEGVNVGFHEFAHLMELEGIVLAPKDRDEWLDLMRKESTRSGRGESLLDDYAFLNEHEFFAVSSELFFTVPRRFRAWHPKLYAVLSRCYRQDPAVWLDTGEPEADSPPRRRRRRGKKV